ncbi:MAG TPA: hypothetical protein VM263_08955 [Acidimicrobiales bacterium]|nr:hypothetical protein [Acidimicrobiales bacterium]
MTSPSGAPADPPRFRALGLAFTVVATDAEVREHVERALHAFRAPVEPARVYTVLDRAQGRREYELHLDDHHLMSSASASEVVRDLVRSLNREAVAATPELVFLHASAVEHDGAAVIFPASMESGKTTLAAGLTRAGLRYVTDELVAVDPRSLTVRPYPKPFSLDPGSWPLFAEARPAAPDGLIDVQWQVPPSAFGDDAVAPDCTPAVIVFPRYQPGVETAVRAVGPAEALMSLAANALNLRESGAMGAAALAALADRCPAYRLDVGQLDAACRIVLDLLGVERRTVAAGGLG